ncbi:Alpha-tectorin [Labeo rohita]|uniref:Alpha-tectorin n=1 Tax=Labeo rohita TaxID=84645 RepID=A0ABQ8MTI1_LABRO|nr:Alpha-tectorin [Labeo rohita]
MIGQAQTSAAPWTATSATLNTTVSQPEVRGQAQTSAAPWTATSATLNTTVSQPGVRGQAQTSAAPRTGQAQTSAAPRTATSATLNTTVSQPGVRGHAQTSAAPRTAAATLNTTASQPGVRDLSDPCFELNCTEDEWCGQKNGVYGCFCNESHRRPDPASFDVSEVCKSSNGFISLSRCQLFEAGFPTDSLHLNDPNCKGTVLNGRVEFYFDNNDHICGTSLLANGTHFIYENFIFGTPNSTEGPISRKRILKLNFSCIYPQTQTLSMNMEINPLESIVHKNLPGYQGRYQVRMVPYQDAEFSQPFAGNVNVEVNQQMFVEIRVEGVDSRQFATVVDTCWATPENDPHHSVRWDLISGECPSSNDDTVELLQNGVFTSSRFSFRMFVFTVNFNKVYLHCSVHLCLLTGNHCSTHCDSGYHWREGRSAEFHDSSSISMGPLMLSERNSGFFSLSLSHQIQLCDVLFMHIKKKLCLF